MSHFDTLTAAPPGFSCSRRTDSTPVAALGDTDAPSTACSSIRGRGTPNAAWTSSRLSFTTSQVFPHVANVSIIEQAVSEIRRRWARNG